MTCQALPPPRACPRTARPSVPGRDGCTQHRRLISRLLYQSIRLTGRVIWRLSIREKVIGAEHLPQHGGYLLSCTHLSHLEPVLLSIWCRRPIDWMTRREFFQWRLMAAVLRRVGCFPVNRQGVPVSAVRTAIDRASAGGVVGICPEGGVTIGSASICRGGKIRRGACLIAQRSGAPVIPCVVLGTDRLNAVGPWLPFRRARLWMAFGPPVSAPLLEPNRRTARAAMAAELERSYQQLYQQLCQRYNLNDVDFP